MVNDDDIHPDHADDEIDGQDGIYDIWFGGGPLRADHQFCIFLTDPSVLVGWQQMPSTYHLSKLNQKPKHTISN